MYFYSTNCLKTFICCKYKTSFDYTQILTIKYFNHTKINTFNNKPSYKGKAGLWKKSPGLKTNNVFIV